MKVAILSMIAVVGAGGVARAEDVEATLVSSGDSSDSSSNDSSNDSSDSEREDDFLSLGSIPQIGIGVNMAGDSPRFDGTLRGGAVFRLNKHLHAGGFLELHTVSFDGFDAAIGPQLQIQLGETAAIQLRGGVGSSPNYGAFTVVGAQVGNAIGGISVTARRPLDGGPTEFSANIEVASALLLLPLWLASDPFDRSNASHSW